MRQIGDLVDSYGGLIEAIRARIKELGVTCESLDSVTGLADGHTTKIISPRRIRVAGRISLGLLLQALNLKIVVCVDDGAAKQYRARLKPTKFPQRWNRELDWSEVKAVAAGRDLRIGIDNLGGAAAIVAVAKTVPTLRSAVNPAPAKKPPAEPVKRPAFNPDERHPMPERRRPMMFGRGQRKAVHAA
jgi:hypothetical protein